jgi:hypothetical protein
MASWSTADREYLRVVAVIELILMLWLYRVHRVLPSKPRAIRIVRKLCSHKHRIRRNASKPALL